MRDIGPVLIGDATREKWIAFLQGALRRGYVTPEEFEQDVDTLIKARRGTEIDQFLTKFDRDDRDEWIRVWEKRREKGLAPRTGMPLPEPASRNWPHILIAAIWGLVALGGWLLFILFMVHS